MYITLHIVYTYILYYIYYIHVLYVCIDIHMTCIYYIIHTECLCPPKIHMLKPSPQCDGIRGCGLWEMIRS